MAAESAEQDLSGEDQIDEQLFNRVIWKGVKSAGSEMPAPRYRLFGPAPGAPADDANGTNRSERRAG